MKQSVATLSVEELKKKYKNDISESEKCLNKIYSNQVLDLRSGWGSPCYNHNIVGNYGLIELLVLFQEGNIPSYAIPVVYCNPDGTSIKKDGWQGKKVWTLFAIMSAFGQMHIEFVPNRYDSHSNLYPDFKSLNMAYRKHFITHVQLYTDEKNFPNQKFFDIDRFVFEKEKAKKEKEDKRRSEPADITVGELEDLRKELKDIHTELTDVKDMIKSILRRK